VHQVPLLGPQPDLHEAVALRLRVDPSRVTAARILKESVDARKRPPLRVASVEATVLGGAEVLATLAGDAGVRDGEAPPWQPPEGSRRIGRHPLVVGTGPAGLFCALALASKGYRPLLIERGKEVRPRWKDVRRYWSTGELDTESNVAFGEGGAGTFSDGKVYTRRNDPRNAFILQVLARAGQAPDILTSARPHLGTNRLSRALFALRDELEAAGVEYRFESPLTDLEVEGGVLKAARVGGQRVAVDAVFLGAGHSARDVHEMLLRAGAPLEARPFAVGARIEHPQSLIDRCQYGDEGRAEELGAASYMLTWNDERRGWAAHTFCTCPGGEVVAASTDPSGLTVNGMSYSHRLQPFCNSAVVVEVTPEDIGGEGPLAGVEFQRRLEERAQQAGGGAGRAPAQRVADFMASQASSGDWETSYRLGLNGCDLSSVLPAKVVQAMRQAIRSFGQRLPGFDREGSLIAVEARTTSPVRVVRDPATGECPTIAGLFPMGEGAGYAGGIVSAASDGLRAAERIAAWRD
jgi:uncharacterized FAD-dependent dehydrogenase